MPLSLLPLGCPDEPLSTMPGMGEIAAYDGAVLIVGIDFGTTSASAIPLAHGFLKLTRFQILRCRLGLVY